MPMQEQIIQGTVVRFRSNLSFGFLAPSDGAPIRGDVLLHENALGEHTAAAIPGAQLVCVVRPKRNVGPRVSRILKCDPPRGATRAQPKWFCERRGFGFLADGTNEDIFVHILQLRAAGWSPEDFRRLRSVFAIAARRDRGRMAIALFPDRQYLGDLALSCSQA
jgi:cold shock CspA family protein